jgi:hypothetical protein
MLFWAYCAELWIEEKMEIEVQRLSSDLLKYFGMRTKEQTPIATKMAIQTVMRVT